MSVGKRGGVSGCGVGQVNIIVRVNGLLARRGLVMCMGVCA